MHRTTQHTRPIPGPVLFTLTLTFLLAAAAPAAMAEEPAPRRAEPGTGALKAVWVGQEEPLELPLKHTSVEADVAGFVSTVKVTQVFGNPYPHPIEAVYVFPLPHDAAVHAMRMAIGERVIEGQIRRREEARQMYVQAREEGRTASLLDQERPNIFTQSVANILPGDDIRVEIAYFQALSTSDGVYELVVPTVVGPRYIPGEARGRSGAGWSADTTRVPDGSRISPPLLPPCVRSGHDIEIEVRLDAGVPFHDLDTPSHAVHVDRRSEAAATITLAGGDTLPNKDFILRWRADRDEPVTGLLTHRPGGEDGSFLLVLHPQADTVRTGIAPREIVFVVDTSGSMHGFPLEQSKRVMEKCLKDLGPDDTFQVILFAGSATVLSPHPLPSTRGNVRKALRFVESARGGGGTEFLPALEKALRPAPDPDRSRIVLFLSDGYIGYEPQVLKYMYDHLGAANVFPLGVGTSVNRYLIDAMARIGQGEPFYLTPDEDPESTVDRFFRYVSRPSLTDVRVRFRGMEVTALQPERLPDLFLGRPLSLTGRYGEAGEGEIVVTGRLAGRPWEQTLSVRFPERRDENAAVPLLWARRCIETLTDRLATGELPAEEAERRVTALALRHHLMSAYTSFVAVDSQVRNREGDAATVAVPVPLPDRVSPWAAPGHAYGTGNTAAGGAPALTLHRSRAKLGVGRGTPRHAESLARPFRLQEDSPRAAPGPEEELGEDEERDGALRVALRDLRVHGVLCPDEVRRVLEKAIEAWLEESCSSGLSGEARLHLTVDEAGRVVHARIDPEEADTAPWACLAERLEALSFPASEARSHLRATVVCSPEPGSARSPMTEEGSTLARTSAIERLRHAPGDGRLEASGRTGSLLSQR